MSHILESAIVVPICILLLAYSIMQIPFEFGRLVETSENYVQIHDTDDKVYQQVSYGREQVQTQVHVKPQKLLDFIHFIDDSAIEIQSILQGVSDE